LLHATALIVQNLHSLNINNYRALNDAQSLLAVQLLYTTTAKSVALLNT